jgi:hypothetical protein
MARGKRGKRKKKTKKKIMLMGGRISSSGGGSSGKRGSDGKFINGGGNAFPNLSSNRSKRLGGGGRNISGTPLPKSFMTWS